MATNRQILTELQTVARHLEADGPRYTADLMTRAARRIEGALDRIDELERALQECAR